MTPGTLIAGRYRIVRLLGRGGMGAVYEAFDQQTEHARAIKLMLDHRVEDPDARARFEREARMSGRIGSPFVVDMIDAGVDPGTGAPYIVMELLDGENLDQRLTRLGPRPAVEVVEHLTQVARALTQMHARQVIHRDLKPSNLFIESHGAPPRIKVLDLGVAKVLSASTGDTTAIVGSMPYMAPEQLRGREIGPATDLYAFGLIAFTLLTGKPYWIQAPGEEALALAMRIADGPSDAASERARVAGVELAPGFDAWFVRATARQPGRRFRSAHEALRTLAVALEIEPPAWEVEGEPAPELPPLPDAEAETAEQGASSPPLVAATESSSRRVRADASTLPPRPPPSQTRPPRTRRTPFVLAAGAAGVAVALWALWPGSARSPLSNQGAVLACSILKVDGEVAAWGWLGAAAGSLACERARVILGGLPTRTRVPAELLDLRRDLKVDDEPYGSDDARARSLEAARRADAYLDGGVTRLGSDELTPRFRVDLVLRRPDGGELGHGSGEGRALYEAVRAAMNGIVDAGAIPTARAPDPVVADYARAGDVATMLHLLDLKLAMVNNAASFETECAWFATADAATDLASFVRYACGYTVGDRPPPAIPPEPSSPGARAARARVEHSALGTNDPVAINALRLQYAAETSSWARSVIAGTLSCLLEGTAPDEARAWAWHAVDDEPKNPTGEWCGPWGQLLSVVDDTSRAGEATAKWRAWAPWESYAWWWAERNTRNLERKLTYIERAYMLSPLDTNLAGELSNRLLLRGNTGRVGAIASKLSRSQRPVHQILSQLLTVQFDASESRFGRALEAALVSMRPQDGDTSWVRAQRLEIAWRAVEIASVLGRAAEVADAAVQQFIDPTPPPLDWGSLDTPRLITAICAYASPEVAERCFARMAALGRGETEFATGARRYAAGDLRGAAEKWRALMRDAGEHIELLAEPMVRAFAAAGEYAQALEIEANTRARGALFDGATMATARAALAARDAGDRDTAAKLAKIVLDAWKTADVKPPILDAMKPLVR